MAEAETGDGEAKGRAVTDFFRKNLTLNIEKRPHQINFLCCMRSLVFEFSSNLILTRTYKLNYYIFDIHYMKYDIMYIGGGIMQNSKENHMVRKQIYLKREQEKQIKKIARLRNVSEAEIIRTAVDSFIARNKPKEINPLFELIGMCKGVSPADLAENHDRYLTEDYHGRKEKK